jgi:hypothetical protein
MRHPVLELVVGFDREGHKRLGQQGRKGKLVRHVGMIERGRSRPQPAGQEAAVIS